MKDIIIKTLDGWHNSPHNSWDAYCNPGDYIDEEVYDYFLNILPPKVMRNGFFQVGEPFDSRKDPESGRFSSTYPTFEQGRNGETGERFYRYLGNCFAGCRMDAGVYIAYGSLKEFLAATWRILPIGKPEQRPRLYCRDGFCFSVQASADHFCRPRADLRNGEYTHVEIGFPNRREDVFLPFAENAKKPTATVYAYVPVEVVETVIQKHGGFFDGRIPYVAAIMKGDESLSGTKDIAEKRIGKNHNNLKEAK